MISVHIRDYSNRKICKNCVWEIVLNAKFVHRFAN